MIYCPHESTALAGKDKSVGVSSRQPSGKPALTTFGYKPLLRTASLTACTIDSVGKPAIPAILAYVAKRYAVVKSSTDSSDEYDL